MQAAPPGWYPDGVTPGVVRWFDGSGWTPHITGLQPAAPLPVAAGGGHGPNDALHWVLPVGRSWQSIVSGYLGLMSLLIWPLAPVAIVIGVLGLRRARTGGHGSGRAVFGIVGGVLGLAFWIAYLASTSA